MKGIGRGIGRALLVLVAACVLYEVWIFAHVLWWQYVNPKTTHFMDLQLSALREDDPKARLQHTWVDYEHISHQLKQAVVAAEDDRFTEHDGFDWEGIQRAMERNARRGKAVAGGSTISQQLAKNLFLTPARSYLRKGQEAIITLMIEACWSKRRILEVYLNVVEWGAGIFGAEAAARHYYGVSAATLDAGQAARLAVMLPNPRRYERHFGPRLAAHAARIRARMHRSEVP
ncbi:monofunctional biosynthetic peptidoglycan transglycosylase [Nitrogeniibacter mangrovi]|uniref:Biosynthetic peptidoglycan transglycosylase n=1 Tax=Nitrogeniibacter mangrovi TaxID=2016596 RepID=A0A6C1BBQ7_9RHOO|nr:monofunctional biosynthetic peptidoglycan transglycosylase [Nitrogeniibacter mangrovi]QID19714.1 monofunctional biosynthetic peptidoglycan transglycosylase [Nitrogeniibacter mangrovi]